MTTTDERTTGRAGEATTTVHVRAFAAARAALGWSERELLTGSGVSVGDLLAGVLADAPDAVDVVARCSVLVDGVRADRSAPVPLGAVVDLLPPFAGG